LEISIYNLSGKIFIPLSILIFAIIFPPELLDRLPHICLIKSIFGRCPADGTLRALSNLLHGDFYKALTCNPNVLVVFPLCIYLILKEGLKSITKSSP